MGPSMKYTGYSEFTFGVAFIPYEPSNGLMSLGIIRRYVPRQTESMIANMSVARNVNEFF